MITSINPCRLRIPIVVCLKMSTGHNQISNSENWLFRDIRSVMKLCVQSKPSYYRVLLWTPLISIKLTQHIMLLLKLIYCGAILILRKRAVELFAENVMRAGESFAYEPMAIPFMPTWSRVSSAYPDFLYQLRVAIEEDNGLHSYRAA